MNERDIVLTPLPQADGKVKNRPALLLLKMPPFGNWLVCGVTSQIHLAVAGFDDLISPQDADFAVSGLKTASLFRLGFLATLPPSSFLGTIGSVSAERHRRLLGNLARHLQPSP
jgi:mRNA interferase MazF